MFHSSLEKYVRKYSVKPESKFKTGKIQNPQLVKTSEYHKGSYTLCKNPSEINTRKFSFE